jgi:hypothetical protein
MEPQALRSGAGEGHPSRADLESFMRGELPQGTRAVVVRHLLRGCAKCRETTARLWSFGEETVGGERDMERSSGGREAMALATARRQLLKLADELATFQLTLRGIQASLPEAPAEAVRLADVEAMDPATELGAVIACVTNDYLGPAERDLRDVLAETKSEDAPEGDATP